MDALKFGASLYVPAIHAELSEIGNGLKIPGLRSVIFCTEDSIADSEVPIALDNIAEMLKQLNKECTDSLPYCFIRPRSPQVLQSLLDMKYINKIHGFVIPKFNLESMPNWMSVLNKYPIYLFMPTLETKDVFNIQAMQDLCSSLLNNNLKLRIPCLRIGGLDLLNLLGIRRCCNHTIYETALQYCIQQLVSIFNPSGFRLTAPAFECLEHPETLQQEIKLDILHGLIGKTAIHPQQIPIIHASYRVSSQDFEAAQALLDPLRPAVFRMNHRMCEKTTHTNWAINTLHQAELYGIK